MKGATRTPVSDVAWKAVIVERSPDVQAMMSRYLRYRGFTIAATLDSPDHAASQVRAHQAQLLILEIEEGEELVLRTIEDLALNSRDLRVIVTAAVAETELILKVLRAGAAEFLVRPVTTEDFNSALNRVLRSLSSTVQGQIFAVYSGKGGLGSTTVAVNLAFSLARSHPEKRVALVDMVRPCGDIQVFLDLSPRYTVSDLIGKVDGLDSQLMEKVLHRHPEGVWVLPETGLPEDADAMTGDDAGEIMSLLRTSFNFVVVDCEHQLTDRTRVILDNADKILVVTVLNVPCVRELQRTVEMCNRLGYTDDKVQIVVNRHQKGDVFSVHDVEKSLDRPVLWRLPNDYKAALDAINQGKPLSLAAPRSKLSRSLDGLAVALNSAQANSRDAPLGARMRRIFVRSKKQMFS